MDKIIDFQKRKEQINKLIKLDENTNRHDELLLKAVVNGLSETEGLEFSEVYMERMVEVADKHSEQIDKLISLIHELLE